MSKYCVYKDLNKSVDERVEDLINRMTVDEKIGQMALVEKNSIHNLSDIHKYGLGGILSGSGAKPDPNTPEEWGKMINNFQKEALKSRLGIPILYGVDAIHGHSHVYGATIFPHFIGLGATNDKELVKKIGEITSNELLATGVNWNFAPNLDVANDYRWGRVYETFGSDPQRVSELGEAFILGSKLGSSPKVVTTAKHYIGTGSMKWGSSTNKNFFIDQGATDANENELRSKDLLPFKKAVDAEVKVVMAGLNSWNGQKMAGNEYLLTTVLKKELGFKGFVVSDWYGVYEITDDKYEAAITAINSGVDMVMLPYEYQKFTSDLKKAIENKRISLERLDDAVRRILKVKFESGLFDQPEFVVDVKLAEFGSKQHKDVAKEAVRKSLVVLKGKELFPLSKSSSIIVSGSAADNLGIQSGAWTLEWQGVDGNWLPGTTILSGIKNLVSPENVQFNKDGNFDDKSLADIGIVVVGEKPYAEGWGDNPNPSVSNEDLIAIEKTRLKSKKLIVIIVSGRPLNIINYSKDWDAVIAAWLPGTEGEGVAEVIFGNYPFSGTLPVKWEIE